MYNLQYYTRKYLGGGTVVISPVIPEVGDRVNLNLWGGATVKKLYHCPPKLTNYIVLRFDRELRTGEHEHTFELEVKGDQDA